MSLEFEYLSSIPLFSALSADEELFLSLNSCRRRFSPNLELVACARPVEHLGIVLSGRVGEYVSRSNGRSLLRVIAAGGSFGNLDPVWQPSSAVSVVAIEPGEILCVASAAVDGVSSSNAQLRRELQAVRQLQLSRLTAHLEILSDEQTSRRIWTFLSLLAEDFRLSDSLGRHVPLPLTHQEIAESCGLTRETVSRKTSALIDGGVLARSELGWVVRSPR